jgi:hypothetical protein
MQVTLLEGNHSVFFELREKRLNQITADFLNAKVKTSFEDTPVMRGFLGEREKGEKKKLLREKDGSFLASVSRLLADRNSLNRDGFSIVTGFSVKGLGAKSIAESITGRRPFALKLLRHHLAHLAN